jgi:RNA polymerase sigma-70 factor (ECF subfamily)
MQEGNAAQRAAIDQAFREESALVLRWLTSRIGDKDDAQDVLQSVYLRTLAFAENNTIDNPRALIFRIAAHLAVDELRRKRRFRANHITEIDQESDKSLSAVSCNTPDSEEILITREEIQSVMRALDKLPGKAKAAFLMNRVYGDTYAEIAEKLGVSVSSVEKYMIKALAVLREVSPPQKAGEKKGARSAPLALGFLTFAVGRRQTSHS